MTYAALHVHSQYSILESTLSVEEIAEIAVQQELKAVALTDSGNMFGVVDFYKACKEKKIPAIVGSEVWLAATSRFEKKKNSSSPLAFPLILLAKDKQGYQNLCTISSLGYLEGFYYHPRIDKEVLKKHHEGLICLSGPINGSVAHAILNRSEEELIGEVQWFLDLFGEDYYFELQRHPMSDANIALDGMEKESWLMQNLSRFVRDQERVVTKLVELSRRFSIPCVATGDVHYRNREDWRAHEILLNIQAGETCEIWEYDSARRPKRKIANPKRRTFPSHEYDFKSPSAMQQLFSDLPEAISHTVQVAEKCTFSFDFSKKYYPSFSLFGDGGTKADTAQYLYNLCVEAIPKRYTSEVLAKVQKKYPNEDLAEVVRKRLDFEFAIISSKELCDYFLIVYDFISWAKKRGIPVGPGRGSVAGSIIAYLLGITEIDPLQFHLFFERFINPERLSYPDIDVDICMARRSEVIDYTIQKYGKDRVAQIITFGTMKAKMAIRDVGRVLNVALSKVNAIAKLVPEELSMTIEKALSLDAELKALYESDEEAKLLLDMAQKLEGSIRNTSIHAAGVIISADPLIERVPICHAKDTEMLVTQFSMKPVESVGLLKIDFLGLKTLTSLQKAAEMVLQTGQKIEWDRLPLDDKKTYDLLNHGKTLGIFQLESGGIQDLAKQLHIDHFEEIIAVVALYRPGPMDMIPSFINRKQKKEVIEIEHPLMKEILEETYGVMVYQEQVMQIASKLADYSLAEADVLRRAMGKKDHQEMQRQREKFVQGASKKGIDAITAIRIFDKIEKFASYGFNKSHATAYAYLTYATSYFKANFPKEWMAALMTIDRDDLSKVAKFIREARALGIAILPPDVNESGEEFTATKEGIRFALTAIKGVGSGVAGAIVKERQKGPYKSLYDFIRRVDKSRVGKKTIELFIDGGAFDFTKWPRDSLRESVDSLYEEASRDQKDRERGILSLFTFSSSEEGPPLAEARLVSKKEDLLKRERELLGFYLSSHPMENYHSLLSELGCIALKDLEELGQDSLVPVAFIIEELIFKISSKSQKKFAILTISDGLERLELPIWNEMYEEKSHLLHEGQLLLSLLQIDHREGSLKLSCRYLEDLTKMDSTRIAEYNEALKGAKKQTLSFGRKKMAEQKKEVSMSVEIKLDLDLAHLSQILDLKKIIQEHQGPHRVLIRFCRGGKSIASLALDHNKIELSERLEAKLKSIGSVLEISSTLT